ncbi:MAG: hypothetical protein PHU94_03830 [Bacilli bacterium]|nr:hypothetical protein [Bacilli bacterium]
MTIDVKTSKKELTSLEKLKKGFLNIVQTKLAKERDEFMKLYFKRFYKEIKGEL